MRPTVTIRPTFSRWLAAVLIACCAGVVVLTAATGHLADAVTLAPPMGLVSVLAWAMLWRPLVEVADGGVTVVNPLRTVHVPWPALVGVDTRWSLTLHTTGGAKVSAFAAPAPTAVGEGSAAQWAHRGTQAGEQHFRADAVADATTGRRRGLSGQAADAVERRRRELTEAGYLDRVHPEGAPVTTRWHVVTVVALVAAVVATALTL